MASAAPRLQDANATAGANRTATNGTAGNTTLGGNATSNATAPSPPPPSPSPPPPSPPPFVNASLLGNDGTNGTDGNMTGVNATAAGGPKRKMFTKFGSDEAGRCRWTPG